MVLGEGLDCLMLVAKQNVKSYCQYGGNGGGAHNFSKQKYGFTAFTEL